MLQCLHRLGIRFIGKASHANWRRQSVIPTSKDELAGEAFFIVGREMEIISRKDAKERGLKRYFTGKLCKHGHISERYVSGGGKCVECEKLRANKKYAKNPSAYREREKKLRAKYPEKARARDKIKRENDKTHIDRTKNWVIKTFGSVKLRSAYRRMLYPDMAAKATARWRDKNPSAARVSSLNNSLNRRNLILKSGGKLSGDLTGRLLKLQKGKCACCKLPLGNNYHLDHITPLFLGGSNTDSNMQLLRAKCNLQKSAKHPIDFMQSKGFLL